MLRLALLLSLVWWAAPAAAFGAGNIASISKVEGKNCMLLTDPNGGSMDTANALGI